MPVFSTDEYQARIAATKQRMEAAGIDVLFVSLPDNMNYLSGYDGWSFYTHQVLLVALDRPRPLDQRAPEELLERGELLDGIARLREIHTHQPGEEPDLRPLNRTRPGDLREAPGEPGERVLGQQSNELEGDASPWRGSHDGRPTARTRRRRRSLEFGIGGSRRGDFVHPG